MIEDFCTRSHAWDHNADRRFDDAFNRFRNRIEECFDGRVTYATVMTGISLYVTSALHEEATRLYISDR
jgi:hypothetical protein